MSPKFLIIPEEAVEELLALLLLDTAQLRRLRELLSERKVAGDGREYARVASGLGVGNEEAIRVLSALSNVRSQRERFAVDDDALYRDLAIFVEGSDGTRDDAYREALLDVLTRSDDEYFAHKVQQLKHALVPHLLEAGTVVDARPVFDKGHTKIEGFLLVAQVELSVLEPGGESSKVVFSLSRKGLRQLQERLKDTELKMDTLAKSLPPDIERFE